MNNIEALNHHNLVVVHYIPFTGGRQMVNLLAYHDQALPWFSVSQKFSLDLWVHDNFSITRKMEALFNSPIVSFESEYFWGDTMENILKGAEVDEGTVALLQNYKCFIANHDLTEAKINQIIDTLPSAKHIIIVIPETGDLLGKFDPTKVFEVDYTKVANNTANAVNTIHECLAWLGLNNDYNPRLDEEIIVTIHQSQYARAI